MNILVCFKAEPDVEMLAEKDWDIDAQLRIDTSFLKPVLSSYDESALEMALMLLDRSKGSTPQLSLNAITIDSARATPILKTLNALRYARVTRIDSAKDLRFRPLAVATMLSQYVIDQAPQDVLIMGKQSSIGENGKTPALVAEMLDWPCISQVLKVEPVDRNHLTVTSQIDEGNLCQRIQTPCVLSIGDVPNTYLRVPTLKDRVCYGQRTIEVLSDASFDIPEETEDLLQLDNVSHGRSAVIIHGQNPEEKAESLFEIISEPLFSRNKTLL